MHKCSTNYKHEYGWIAGSLDTVRPRCEIRKAVAHFNRRTIAGEMIDYRQEPEAVPVEELSGHEVHVPALIDTSGLPQYFLSVPVHIQLPIHRLK
jgi:hypothetical protein